MKNMKEVRSYLAETLKQLRQQKITPAAANAEEVASDIKTTQAATTVLIAQRRSQAPESNLVATFLPLSERINVSTHRQAVVKTNIGFPPTESSSSRPQGGNVWLLRNLNSERMS